MADFHARYVRLFGPVNRFLEEQRGMRERESTMWSFTNRYVHIYAAMMAHLTKGMRQSELRKPIGELMALALKKHGIKSLAEVGPSVGTDALTPMAPFLREAGVQPYVIGVDGKRAEEFAGRGIIPISAFAGNLGKELGDKKIDIFFARRVFSLGGAHSGYSDADEVSEFFREKTGEVHDLIEHSSDKPGSIIVLTEDSDKLHLDRESLEKKADILKWDQWQGSSGFGRWAQALREEGYHREAKLVEEAPNFVVLKRKTVAAARTRKRSP